MNPGCFRRPYRNMGLGKEKVGSCVQVSLELVEDTAETANRKDRLSAATEDCSEGGFHAHLHHRRHLVHRCLCIRSSSFRMATRLEWKPQATPLNLGDRMEVRGVYDPVAFGPCHED